MSKSLFLRGKALFLAMVVLSMSVIGSVNISAATNTTMRDISSIDLVKEMQVGWNLGNTFDATGATGETSWGNPKTSKAMIDKVKEMGFNTVRFPISWGGHVGASPDYTIDQTWINRVEEVVNYALDNNMYAIVNLHHEDTWLIPTYANEAKSKAELTKIWEQVATKFQNYGDHLIFETMNEPRVVGSAAEWTGGTAENRSVINSFNLAAVNTIRASGGNNAKRHIMIPTHGASALAIDDLVIPNNDSRIIVSIHSYSPYYFSMVPTETASWGTSSEKTALSAELDVLYNKFVKNGRAVVIGEFGTIDKNNVNARVTHAEYYAKEARARGITPIWWDNGFYGAGKSDSYALLNRSGLTWYYPEIANALVRGTGATITPYPTQIPVTPTNSPTPTPTKPGTQIYQAESGKLTGTTVESSTPGYSGSGYVTSFDEAGDTVEITVNQAAAGECDLTIGYAGIYGTKNNDVYVNGTLIGNQLFSETTGFSEVYVGKVNLNQGANTIKIANSWGWFLVDYIAIDSASGSTTTTPTITPTPTATPTGGQLSTAGFKVSGTKLLDANGNEFIIRGVNHSHTWYKSELNTAIPAMAKAGANTVRIVLADGGQWTKDSADDVSNIISLCEQNKMIAVLEVHDATGKNDEASLLAAANYFADIKSALVGKEKTVIINIANEWGGTWDSAAWLSGYKKAIPVIRNAGLTHTILVDSTGWGQYGQCVKDSGKDVFAADTLKNTMFAVHMYGTAGKDATTIKSNIDGALNQGLCMIVGEFGWNHSDGDVDEATIMSYCKEKNVGWMAWSWKGNGGGVEYLDMCNDWAGTSLSTWGNTIINGTNGLKATSKICSVFSGSTVTPTPTVKLGDVNGDNVRDSGDYTILRRYLLRIITTFPSSNGAVAADVNKDGKVDSADYTLLRKALLGQVTL